MVLGHDRGRVPQSCEPKVHKETPVQEQQTRKQINGGNEPVSKTAVAAVVLLLLTCTPSTWPQSASPIFFSYDKSGFSATGSWIPADSKTRSSGHSETEIDCFQDSLSCV